MLYLDHAEFIPFIAEAIGISMWIHEDYRSDRVFDESTAGVQLSTGFDTHVGLTLACHDQCLALLLITECTSHQNDEECTPSDDFECKMRLRESIHSRCPECKQPCHEKVYEQRITMTRWPSRSTVPMIHKMLNDTNHNTE
ncbi:degenerin unc-8-like [Argopecten irradians]|uniref:degenerin unc-8-like n=1 Tax=Argopecten irradians TaxID=31199 RepID=UPI0037228D95